jgi:anthranilate phosphoribosyltransferase
MVNGGERAIVVALRRLSEGSRLSTDESAAAVLEIVDGGADPAEIAAFLTALRLKGETPDELAGAVRAVRSRMTRLEVPARLRPLLDTCGTGGDGAATLNLSTAAAIVTAACGVRVAKHGNRSASGRCGSAEVLEELGVNIAPTHETLLACLEEVGIAFLLAPRFHPALAHAGPVRKKLPFRTIFNLIGPLANPAGTEFQLIGVPGVERLEVVAQALESLGVTRAAVVTSGEGLDEVTLSGKSIVAWIEGGQTRREEWTPEEFGMHPTRGPLSRVENAEAGASVLLGILEGATGADRDAVVANSAAALRVVGRVANLEEGATLASEALEAGAARGLLEQWRQVSRREAGGASGEARALA